VTRAGWFPQAGRGLNLPARLAAPVLAGLLAACGSGEAEQPAGVSAGEARALDDAATMLEEQRHAPAAEGSASPSPSPSS